MAKKVVTVIILAIMGLLLKFKIQNRKMTQLLKMMKKQKFCNQKIKSKSKVDLISLLFGFWMIYFLDLVFCVPHSWALILSSRRRCFLCASFPLGLAGASRYGKKTPTQESAWSVYQRRRKFVGSWKHRVIENIENVITYSYFGDGGAACLQAQKRGLWAGQGWRSSWCRAVPCFWLGWACILRFCGLGLGLLSSFSVALCCFFALLLVISCIFQSF